MPANRDDQYTKPYHIMESIAGREVGIAATVQGMKIFLSCILVCLVIVLFGCATFSAGNEFAEIDALIEDASWEAIQILWNHYEDLEEGPTRTMAVYYFVEDGAVSARSDTLIEGLTTQIANAIAYEGVRVGVVSRTNLDRILEELSFQSSDLVDPQTQRSVGRQLGADIIVTGVIEATEQGEKFNIQLIEVQTGVVLGGMIKYLLPE